MQKRAKNIINKLFKLVIFLAMIAGIVWINALKLQDESLSNYEKITDTGTRDYYNEPVSPVIAALFYISDIQLQSLSVQQPQEKKDDVKMAVIPKDVNSFNLPVINKLYEEIPDKNNINELILIYTEKKNAKKHSDIFSF